MKIKHQHEWTYIAGGDPDVRPFRCPCGAWWWFTDGVMTYERAGFETAFDAYDAIARGGFAFAGVADYHSPGTVLILGALPSEFIIDGEIYLEMDMESEN